MDWATSSAWIAWKHPLLGHVPVAVAILLPWALLAAQRPGRGIKPWWVTCRYLAWAGFLGSLAALLSGQLLARKSGLLGSVRGTSVPAALHLHQLLALASLGAGVLCLLVLFRRRQEHQGLGILGLLAGVLWAALLLVTGANGAKLGRPAPPPQIIQVPVPVASPVPAAPKAEAAPPASSELLELLDYGRLVSLHPEPVKSLPHGNRWIRAWVSPEAVEAYRSGAPLPEGARIVLSSLEDRWGRPGFEAGPLCGIRIQGGKARFSYHWARVPEAKRGETGGADQASWMGEAPQLQACLGCHAQGTVPRAERSSFTVPRKPKELSGDSPSR